MHPGADHPAVRQRAGLRRPARPDRLGPLPDRPDDVRLGRRPGGPAGRRGPDRAGPAPACSSALMVDRGGYVSGEGNARVGAGLPHLPRRPQGRAERPRHRDARPLLPVRPPQARRDRRPDRLDRRHDPDASPPCAAGTTSPSWPRGRSSPSTPPSSPSAGRSWAAAPRPACPRPRRGRRRPQRRRSAWSGPTSASRSLKEAVYGAVDYGQASHLPREPLLQRPDPRQEAGRRAGAGGRRPGRPDACGATSATMNKIRRP